jgi:hypothetical protein
MNKEDITPKIKQYKKNTKISNINDIILSPVVIVDVLLIYNFFKDDVFENFEEHYIYI